MSVTYGAGGTTRDLTRDAMATLHKSSGLKVATHLTCVNATREETLKIANDFAQAGVTDIVALRGDPPKGSGGFVPHPEGFANSVELIEALADAGDFAIRVGAYPDVHPEAASGQADIDWLKAKLDAGATEALTQFFFEADTFFAFATPVPRPVSITQSRRASCRSRTGKARAISPATAAPRSRNGSKKRSTSRPATGGPICWPLHFVPNYAAN